MAVAALVLGSTAACSGDAPSTDRTTTTAPPAGAPSSTSPSTRPGADAAPPVPGDEWTVVEPEAAGMDPEQLALAEDYAFAPELHTQAVVVVRHGEIVHERYADGADEDSWAASWSMAKSFSSALVGIALDEGLIPSVDEPMTTYIPEWAGTERASMTLRHVLQMSSGLAWNEDYDPTAGPSDIVSMVVGAADQLEYATTREPEVAPGTRWAYSSGDSMLLSTVLQQATGRSAGEYAQEKLFDPIGMGPVDWWTDAEGHTLTYCCIDTTSRSFARFGLLYLHDGAWGDRQVVPEAWVEESLTPVADQERYGYQWWLGFADDVEGIPDDAFRAQGLDGQWIYVVPSLDLVVVRNGTYVKSPDEPVADPALAGRYPPSNLVPGKGTRPPEAPWDHEAFLRPIVDSITDD